MTRVNVVCYLCVFVLVSISYLLCMLMRQCLCFALVYVGMNVCRRGQEYICRLRWANRSKKSFCLGSIFLLSSIPVYIGMHARVPLAKCEFGESVVRLTERRSRLYDDVVTIFFYALEEAQRNQTNLKPKLNACATIALTQIGFFLKSKDSRYGTFSIIETTP